MAGEERESRSGAEPLGADAWLRAILDETRESIVLLDPDARVVAASRAARRLLAELSGRDLADGEVLAEHLRVDPGVEGLREPFERALAGEVASASCLVAGAATQECRLDLRYTPAPDPAGASPGVLVHLSENGAIDPSDEAYRTVAESSFQGLLLLTGSRLVYANEAAARNFGRALAEFRKLSPAQIVDCVHPEDRVGIRKRFVDRVTGLPVSESTEFRIVRSDGSVRQLEAHVRDVLYRGERAVQVVHRDVTEQREALRALRESEALNRQLIEQAPVGIVATDAVGNPTIINPAAVTLLGSPSAEMSMRLNVFQLPTLRGTELAKAFEAAVATRSLQRVEGHYRSIWGKESDVSLSVSPLLDEEADIAGTLAIIEDVTERWRSEVVRSTLLELARDMSGSLDPLVIVESACRRTRELLAAAGAAVLRLVPPGPAATGAVVSPIEASSGALENAERDRAAGAALEGRAAGHPATAVAGRLEERIAGSPEALAALRRGESLAATGESSASWMDGEALRTLDLGALLVVPLATQTLGGLAVWRHGEAPPFSTADVSLAEGIARQVALALSGAELHRAQQEEARIASALARVGQELISKLNDPSLLDLLCRVTAEVLECDRSTTVLLDIEAGVYAAVASHGRTAEQWEIVRQLRFPADFDPPLTERVWREHVVEVSASDDSRLATLARRRGISRLLCIALRRGDALIGIQTAELEGEGHFDTSHARIARGIAQLASLALEDARLMAQLERASRLKSEFVATMSHELRTPLHIILGYLDLVLDGAFGDLAPDQRDSLERADRSARVLLDLINATLDMSRLETGRLTLDLREVAPSEVVDQLDADTRELQAQSGLSFSWRRIGDLPLLLTDAGKLRTVLRNLVVNAVKYTSEGSVSVDVRARSGGVEFSVRDTGAGIPAESRSEIFEPFRQLETTARTGRGGVGLGLYIVRRLIEELGGAVEVESTLGRGSTFSVWLPLVARPGTERGK